MSAQKNKQLRENKVLALLRDDGERCHYCRVRLLPMTATLDHVIPKALGGPATYWNMVTSCAPCNNELSDNMNKCDCRKCNRARDRFYKERKETTKEVIVAPRTVMQWVTPRHVGTVVEMLRGRRERCKIALTKVDPDSHHAAALRGKLNGYGEALVLLAAAYDDTDAP